MPDSNIDLRIKMSRQTSFRIAQINKCMKLLCTKKATKINTEPKMPQYYNEIEILLKENCDITTFSRYICKCFLTHLLK